MGELSSKTGSQMVNNWWHGWLVQIWHLWQSKGWVFMFHGAMLQIYDAHGTGQEFDAHVPWSGVPEQPTNIVDPITWHWSWSSDSLAGMSMILDGGWLTLDPSPCRDRWFPQTLTEGMGDWGGAAPVSSPGKEQ